MSKLIHLPINGPIPISTIWSIEIGELAPPNYDYLEFDAWNEYIKEQTGEEYVSSFAAFPVDDYHFRINYENKDNKLKTIIIPYTANLPKTIIRYE